MEKRLTDSKGFTLIELLVYMSIMIGALLVFTNFMIDISKSAQRAQITNEVEQNSQFIISRITQSIRTSLAIVSLQNDRIEIISRDNHRQIFSLSGTSLQEQVDAQPATQLSSDHVRITNLGFAQNENAITLQLTVEQKNSAAQASQRHVSVQQTTITPRIALYD